MMRSAAYGVGVVRPEVEEQLVRGGWGGWVLCKGGGGVIFAVGGGEMEGKAGREGWGSWILVLGRG